MDPEERRRRRRRQRELRRERARRASATRPERGEIRPPAGEPGLAESIREERELRRSDLVLARHEFESDEEMHAFLASPEYRRELAEVEPSFNLEEKAQELMFEALAARAFEQAVSLAEQAIRLDPDCVDARLVLAAAHAEDQDEYIDLLYRAAAAGERWLGDEYYEEYRGRFWSIANTRPYMRALYQLGLTLLRENSHEDEDEAVHVFEDMLELNPDDDQGARLFLIAVFLKRGDLGRVRELFQRYPDDPTGTAVWARVFERVLAGDPDGAREKLDLARQWSPRVEPRLLSGEAPPEEEPSDDQDFAAWLLFAVCRENPRMLEWLRAAGG